MSGDARDFNNIETRAVMKFYFPARQDAEGNLRQSTTQKKLAYLGFQCLDHPPYSQDLAPLDYHVFPGLKRQLKGRHFSSDAEVIAAAETWLDGQPSEFFLSSL